jgi:hypothetical protein
MMPNTFRGLSLLLTSLVLTSGSLTADDPIFSGPQLGEELPSLEVRGLSGEQAGQQFDLVAQAKGKPIVVIFVHQLTRPGLALTNTVMRFAASRAKSGLVAGFVFLTDDVTKTEAWAKRAQAAVFAKGVAPAVSLDGLEGPGAYGLNRNVTLTVLIANKNRVTANFALVQPSEQADGPKIFEQLAQVSGGGPVPDIAQFSRRRYKGQAQARLDPMLTKILRPLLNKDADQDTLQRVTEQVTAYLDDKPARQRSLGQAASQLIKRDLFAQIKNSDIRKQIQMWARRYGAPPQRAKTERQDPNLRPLLMQLIQKTATEEQVDQAARKLEQYIAKHPDVERQLGRIARTVVGSGKLANYGTPAAQAHLKKWAKTLALPKPSEKTKP